MKFLKIYLILTLVIVLLIPACTHSKKRDLSTPLSRLVGHWQDRHGFQYYFTHTDSYTMTGYLLHVFPNIEKLKKFSRKLLESYASEMEFKSKEEAKKWIEKMLKQFYGGIKKEELEKISERTTYCRYEVLSQAPEEIKIGVSWPKDYAFMIHFPEEPIFYIEQNGKQMIVNGEWGELINPLKYINSKTSPEDK